MKNKYKNETLLANVANSTVIFFLKNVKNILENGMIPKLIQDKTITNIKTDLKKSLTFSDTYNINERLQDIHKIQSLKLREKQRKKFVWDGINPNTNIPLESSVTSEETTWQKRRFSKHNEINRDQNDTVVNLSSLVKMGLCQ